MRWLLVVSLMLILSLSTEAAPIPKSLKAKKNYNFDGVWEPTSLNVDGKNSTLIHGKYWLLDKDTFYYSMPTIDPKDGGIKESITTPDESQPQHRIFSTSRCLLELEDDDTLKWIFSTPTDTLEKCEPGHGWSLYTFKRVK